VTAKNPPGFASNWHALCHHNDSTPLAKTFNMPLILKLLALCCYFVSLHCLAMPPAMTQASPLYHPTPALSPQDLAIIVNDNEPLSQQIADYYRQQRHIPLEQVIHIRLPAHRTTLSPGEFERIRQQVETKTPKQVQAYLLTWLQPFRVDCMSITTAFAIGFDPAFCAEGCQQTRKSPYFASEATRPFDKHGWRPTMMLGASTLTEAKALIDRGVSADYSQPKGSAYLLKTADQARSSRAMAFGKIAETFNPFWPVHYLEQDSIAGHDDVMFYFTGLVSVPHLKDNRFLPGAIADHLTSAGGILSGSDQMSLVEWLKAGATASYGAVIEPCNFPAKFPNPAVVLYFYLRGSSLIEAYWKSVEQPGQGIFVGEPLAKPFAYPAKPQKP